MQYKGNEYESNTTCDSTFMKQHMMEIGKAICDAYYWLPDSQEIELQMDNAGGHGTKDCIHEYVYKC